MEQLIPYVKYTFAIYFLVLSHIALGTIYAGRVVDISSRTPIAGAKVSFSGEFRAATDQKGYFNFTTSFDENEKEPGPEIKANGDHIFWQSGSTFELRITNLLGQNAQKTYKFHPGTGSVSVNDLSNGIYLLSVNFKGFNRSAKLLKANSSLKLSEFTPAPFPINNTNDSISIEAEGYFEQKFTYSQNNGVFGMLSVSDTHTDYLPNLPRPEAFVRLQSKPFNPTFGEVKSVKIVYSIKDRTIYYINSEKYLIHYDFAEDVLHYNKGHYLFNIEQYKKNPNRIYYLASLNHFISSDIYTIDFFPGDEIDCQEIETVFKKVAQTTFIGNKLRFYSNTPKWDICSGIPTISSDELYKGQNYQPLNLGENYGYLKKIEVSEMGKTYVGRHDIVLLNEIPNDISVTAGIITTDFQTPLSHINVLSHNRGTPNMALRDGWTNPKTERLLNKLVFLKVSLDSFSIREATLNEAQAFWASKEPQTPQKLKIDTITSGLVNLATASVRSVQTIGGKAANFAELMKIKAGNNSIPLPEGAFAIPVCYYWQHVKKYGLQDYIKNMVANSAFQEDALFRAKMLKKLQDSIKSCPIDPSLIKLVNDKLQQVNGFSNIRFRSSTNAEDIDGFNGAGLYDSFTGIPGDPEKTIEKAIRKVWASLWNFRAFEERDYFKIDQLNVAMAVLVHRSFPAEEANGVVITKNLYNPYNPAITINVQVGEISIVLPTENYLPDQIIYYLDETQLNNAIEYVSHSNVPGAEGKTVLTTEELKTLRTYCMAIQNHYCSINPACKPMDIEFKVDKVNGIRKLYIKQARLY